MFHCIFENFESLQSQKCTDQLNKKMSKFNVFFKKKKSESMNLPFRTANVNGTQEAGDCWRWRLWQDVSAHRILKGRIPRGIPTSFFVIYTHSYNVR